MVTIITILSIAGKVILGSGLIALAIRELYEAKRKKELKARIEEEIASEFFINEYGINRFLVQVQNLSTYSNVTGRKYYLSLLVIKSVLSSGYFLYLDADLVHLLVEYAGRFDTFNRDLNRLYNLKGEERKTRASGMWGETSQLSMELSNSSELNKLREKYLDAWKITNEKRIEQFFGPELSL